MTSQGFGAAGSRRHHSIARTCSGLPPPTPSGSYESPLARVFCRVAYKFHSVAAWPATVTLGPHSSRTASPRRILTTLLLLQAGYAYVPYSSFESMIENSKEAYSLALRQTQSTLNNNTPDWQPWLLFFLRALQQQKRRLATKVEREKSAITLTDLAVKILDYARDHGRVTTRDMVREHGASPNTLKATFSSLVEKRLLVRHGEVAPLGTHFSSASALFRHLSPFIVPKRNFLPVVLTISPVCPDRNYFAFSCLYMPETIDGGDQTKALSARTSQLRHASGFSRIGHRSAQRELGDSYQGSKARRRKSAALTQAVVDRWRRSPNSEVALAQSMRVFHLCWRR